MSEKKYVVPEGMLKAVDLAISIARLSGQILIAGQVRDVLLKTALKWMADNPVEPDDAAIEEIVKSCGDTYLQWEDMTEWRRAKIICMEWQSRMFLAPEPETPEELKDLLDEWAGRRPNNVIQVAILEAYRRGQKAGAK